jgi:tetratricopeptide (TPR) repeat protein
MSSDEAVVNQIVALSNVGRYADAAAKARDALEDTLSRSERLPLVSILSRILKAQGYWKEALETLESEIATFPESFGDSSLSLQIQIEVCLLKPAISATFSGHITTAANLHRRLMNIDTFDELDPATVSSIPYSDLLPSFALTMLLVLPRFMQDYHT